MNTKTKKIVTLILATAIVGSFAMTFAVQTADATAIKIEIPGTRESEGVEQGTQASDVTVGKYIKAVFDWAMGIVGVAALIMVIYGGYQYMTSAGNKDLRKKARETITQALIGLAIALSIFMFLNVLDPDLLTLDLNVKTIFDPDNPEDPYPGGYGCCRRDLGRHNYDFDCRDCAGGSSEEYLVEESFCGGCP